MTPPNLGDLSERLTAMTASYFLALGQSRLSVIRPLGYESRRAGDR